MNATYAGLPQINETCDHVVAGIVQDSSPHITRAGYQRAIRSAILRHRWTPVQAEYTAAGNCVFCGEAGRCPGWHVQAVQHVDDPQPALMLY